MKKVMVMLLAFALLSGCASNTGIVKIGKDTYMVSRQAATGFSGSGDLKAKCIEEARQFCEKQGKELQVISTWEASPPYILANFPKAEIQFMCLDINDPRFKPPQLEKSPDMVIKKDETIKADVNIRTKDANATSTDLYTELMKLDDLRKKNILTEEEFQAQKKRLLETQR
jgi:hypothetical protein